MSVKEMSEYERGDLELREQQLAAQLEGNRLLLRTTDPALVAADAMESQRRARKNFDGRVDWVGELRELHNSLLRSTVTAVIHPRPDHPGGVLFAFKQGVVLDHDLVDEGFRLAAETGDVRQTQAVLLAMQRVEAAQNPKYEEWLASNLSLATLEARIESAAAHTGAVAKEALKRFQEWRLSEVLMPLRRLIGQPWSKIAPQFDQPHPPLIITDSGRSSRFPIPEGAIVEGSPFSLQTQESK